MPTRIENKNPCPRIPTLPFSDILHSSSQVHIRHVRGLPGEGWGGYALALLVISEIACCLDCCCHISFLPFCQLPVLTERIAASFQGHVTYMPSLCWSFLRLPVAWIVVVTSLSSLSANCQCLLRGLPPVFRATSPIASTL